jgi:hypothetical protein
MAPAGLELLDEAQQVADRTDEAVEPYHDQRFTGGVLLQDCGADRSAEFVALRVSSLFVGRDPCIADPATCCGSFLAFGWHGGG